MYMFFFIVLGVCHRIVGVLGTHSISEPSYAPKYTLLNKAGINLLWKSTGPPYPTLGRRLWEKYWSVVKSTPFHEHVSHLAIAQRVVGLSMVTYKWLGTLPIQLKQKRRIWRCILDPLESQVSLSGATRTTRNITYICTNAFSSADCLLTQVTLQGQSACSHLLYQLSSNFSFVSSLRC